MKERESSLEGSLLNACFKDNSEAERTEQLIGAWPRLQLFNVAYLKPGATGTQNLEDHQL